MESECPSKCIAAAQRPLEPIELSLLSRRTRAEIVRLGGTAKLCEACGAIFVNSRTGTTLVDRVPISGRR